VGAAGEQAGSPRLLSHQLTGSGGRERKAGGGKAHWHRGGSRLEQGAAGGSCRTSEQRAQKEVAARASPRCRGGGNGRGGGSGPGAENQTRTNAARATTTAGGVHTPQPPVGASVAPGAPAAGGRVVRRSGFVNTGVGEIGLPLGRGSSL
jgi:hypothetical protein